MNCNALEQIPFFVYGTLIPGQPNDHLWGDGIESIEPAVYTNGNLFDMGYYPMLIEGEGGTVRGKLISVSTRLYVDILNGLDNLEGYNAERTARSSFTRVRRAVVNRSGQEILSWLYVGRQEQAQDRQVIPDGDWVAFAADLHVEMDIWWESVDTVLGLHDRGDG